MEKSLELKLLEILSGNSRLDAEELSVMLGVDADEIRNTIDRLEKEKVICGYNTLIDWDKVHDDDVTAMVELRVTPQGGEGYDKIAEKISSYPQVDTLFLMSGSYDFLVTVKGRSIKEVSLFVSGKLAQLDEVQSTTTHFTLSKYKELGVLFKSKKTDERILVSL